MPYLECSDLLRVHHLYHLTLSQNKTPDSPETCYIGTYFDWCKKGDFFVWIKKKYEEEKIDVFLSIGQTEKVLATLVLISNQFNCVRAK